MKHYIYIKNWFEQRLVLERWLLLILCWVFNYAFFYFLFFQSLDAQENSLTFALKDAQNQIINWHIQIQALENLVNSPLYQQWAKQHATINKLSAQYNLLLKSTATKQWQTIIKTMLANNPNINLLDIKNSPESIYNPGGLEVIASKIYQQALTVTITSNYFETFAYLSFLEKNLPNLYWDALRYDVIDYPLAKIVMEFLVLYEKNSP